MTGTTRTRTRKPAGPTLPPKAELDRLKLSPEVAWYLLSRGIPLPDCPPRWKTPEPRSLKGARFDPERVDRVIGAMRHLKHTKGSQFAGRPLVPDPWQVAYVIAPVFGWVRESSGHWARIISNLYVDIPRRNGKTTLAGGLAMYLTCADGEDGAEVYALAAGKDQARKTFDPVKAIAEKSPAVGPNVKCLADKIVHKRSGSFFQVVSSVADLMHGANVHGAVIDELHVHKKPDLVETVETGTGSRLQPLVAIITTADDGRMDTIYARKRKYVEQLARKVIKDSSTYGVVWCADPNDDPFAETTQRKANPGYGISPTREYLDRAAKRAQNSPADLASYLRLHLGIRTKQAEKYIEMPVWDRPKNATVVDVAAFHGKPAYGGLDLAATSDLLALAWTFPAADGSYDTIWRYWTPEDNIRRLDERAAGMATVWVRQGWLQTTPGDVADYDFLRADINADRERFDVREIAYDPWNSTQLVNNLTDDGATMTQMRQGYVSMSPPTKEILRLLRSGMYRHGGNPITRWCVDNLAVSMDPAGNLKPDKSKAGDKIDGFVAAVMALDRAINRPKVRVSAYESGAGLMVV
jgi:phage terminase large subunit-like protein